MNRATKESGSNKTWQIVPDPPIEHRDGYIFEVFNMIHDGKKILSRVGLSVCYRYAQKYMRDTDTLEYDGSVWTGAEWRRIWA